MTTYMPLDCDGFAAELADYLEGDAPDAVRAAMETSARTAGSCWRTSGRFATKQRRFPR